MRASPSSPAAPLTDTHPTITLIQDTDGLIAVEQAIRAAPQVALDTEFHAERRHHPELMLLQLATSPAQAWVVDPQAVSPAALADALSETELIVHGGFEDLRLLHALGVRPQRIFDVQQAAGLLGHRYPERLSTLCMQVLEQHLAKGSALSDWSARPLSDQQLRYAAEDALMLWPLADRLKARLSEKGRLDWAFSVGHEQLQRATTPPDLWRQWDVARLMSPEEQRTLAALLVWRERESARRNQPPNYILANGMLLELSRSRPAHLDALRSNRRLHPSLIKRHGRTLLRLIAEAPSHPDPPTPLTPPQRRLKKALTLWTELIGEQEQIAPGLLLPEVLLEQVIRQGAQVLVGWRQPLQGALGKFLTGGTCISVADGSVLLRSNGHDEIFPGCGE